MTRVTQEEVRKIAKMSAIEVREDELETLARDMEAVLSYAAVLQEVAARYSDKTVVDPLPKNQNIMRSDACVPQDPQVILKEAPERIDDYFVVPVIVK